jgi:hypothetical protein
MNNVAEAVYDSDVSCFTNWISIFIFPERAPCAVKRLGLHYINGWMTLIVHTVSPLYMQTAARRFDWWNGWISTPTKWEQSYNELIYAGDGVGTPFFILMSLFCHLIKLSKQTYHLAFCNLSRMLNLWCS